MEDTIFKEDLNDKKSSNFDQNHDQMICSCNICGLDFSSNQELQKHINDVYTLDEYLSCDICYYTTTNESFLKVHKSSMHEQFNMCDFDEEEYDMVIENQISNLLKKNGYHDTNVENTTGISEECRSIKQETEEVDFLISKDSDIKNDFKDDFSESIDNEMQLVTEDIYIQYSEDFNKLMKRKLI